MARPQVPLILPAESQVRELDPKLLLACVAAERGFTVYFGSRLRVHFAVASFPRGIFLSKSMTARSTRMFGILERLGHQIVSWDEEALVHLGPYHYYARRLDPGTFAQLAFLFAWGEENAEMFRKWPQYPGTPIHVTGNPRGDMLRPELRPFFDDETRSLRDRFGDFILVNTNFAMVNAFLSKQNLLQPASAPGAKGGTGVYAVGLEREFTEGFAAHKTAVFRAFQKLIPFLEESFPDHTIIVRPHPVESWKVWNDLARGRRNVQVLHEGNVIPWLRACRAVIHNGCTTGVEAYALGVPAIAYRPVTSERFDFHLPNTLSHECHALEPLRAILDDILRGVLGSPQTAERQALLDHHLSAQSGRFASERLVDVLEQSDAARIGLPRPPFARRARGWLDANRRSFMRRYVKSLIPGNRSNPAYQEQRFPGVSQEELTARIARLGRVVGRFESVRAVELSRDVFRIEAR